MSWSLSFTGKMGIVKDSYHRFALTVNLSPSTEAEVAEEALATLVTLVEAGSKHVLFRVTEPWKDQSHSACVSGCIMQYINRLHSNNHTSQILNLEKLTHNLSVMIMAPIQYALCPVFLDFLTHAYGDTGVRTNLFTASDISPDGDDYSPNYHEVIKSFGNMVQLVRAKSSTLMLGVADVFNRKTLQHLFDAHGGHISLCLPGNLDLPNMHARNVEFIHGRGCNTFYYLSETTITELDRETVPTLEPLLEKYEMAKNNLGTLLVKMIIQYGPVPCIDIALGLDYLMDFITHITHPFVYRTAQQAPTVGKRYQIQKSDIEDLVLESEEVECKEDEVWMRANLHTVAKRVLTDKNVLLQKKINVAAKFL